MSGKAGKAKVLVFNSIRSIPILRFLKTAFPKTFPEGTIFRMQPQDAASAAWGKGERFKFVGGVCYPVESEARFCKPEYYPSGVAYDFRGGSNQFPYDGSYPVSASISRQKFELDGAKSLRAAACRSCW